MTDTYPDTPEEVYVSSANYVRLDVKETTAKRLVGWLRTLADYCDVAGHDKTAEDARHVANRFAQQLDDEEVEE